MRLSRDERLYVNPFKPFLYQKTELFFLLNRFDSPSDDFKKLNMLLRSLNRGISWAEAVGRGCGTPR